MDKQTITYSVIGGILLFLAMSLSSIVKASGLSYTEEMIQSHEGVSLRVYKDHLGNLTVGVGHLVTKSDNLSEGDSIDYERMHAMFRKDVVEARRVAKTLVTGFEELHWKARVVLTNMSFQLGYNRLKSFKKTIAFLENKEYTKASVEMLNSDWAKQTPSRAKELSTLMGSIN